VSTFGHPEWARTHEPASSTSPAVSTLVQSGATCIGTTVLDDLSYGFVRSSNKPYLPFLFCHHHSNNNRFFFIIIIISASVAKISISEHLPTQLSPLVYQAAPLVVLPLLLLLISLISLWVSFFLLLIY